MHRRVAAAQFDMPLLLGGGAWSGEGSGPAGSYQPLPLALATPVPGSAWLLILGVGEGLPPECRVGLGESGP